VRRNRAVRPAGRRLGNGTHVGAYGLEEYL